MRFFFQKTNNPSSKPSFDKRMDRAWPDVPHGRVLVEFTRIGNIREYYWKCCMPIYCEYTGHSMKEAHAFFKKQFAHMFFSGPPEDLQVFRHKSLMSEADKERFVHEVRSFIRDKCGEAPDPWRGIE